MRLASAGLAPAVEIAMARGPVRMIAGRMKLQSGGTSTTFTSVARRPASSKTPMFTSGSPVAAIARKAPPGLADALEPLAQLALLAAVGELEEALAGSLGRHQLLLRDALRAVVRVLVALASTERPGPVVVGVAQVRRR